MYNNYRLLTTATQTFIDIGGLPLNMDGFANLVGNLTRRGSQIIQSLQMLLPGGNMDRIHVGTIGSMWEEQIDTLALTNELLTYRCMFDDPMLVQLKCSLEYILLILG